MLSLLDKTAKGHHYNRTIMQRGSGPDSLSNSSAVITKPLTTFQPQPNPKPKPSNTPSGITSTVLDNDHKNILAVASSDMDLSDFSFLGDIGGLFGGGANLNQHSLQTDTNPNRQKSSSVPIQAPSDSRLQFQAQHQIQSQSRNQTQIQMQSNFFFRQNHNLEPRSAQNVNGKN
jgi:hypothetical protein